MQMGTKKYINTYNFLIPLIVFTIIWAFIFISSGIFNAGFNYFVDDHEIVLNHQNYTSFNDILVKPFTALFSAEPKGRFRPLYDVFIRLFSQVYGLNPSIWYFSSFLVATITTGIFYIVGRLNKFSGLEASGFAGLIVFGQQASTYTRFGTPETTSTFLVALAFLFGSLNFKNNISQTISNLFFVFLAILSALNKEACILLLPALCFFKIWNLSTQNGITLKEAFFKSSISVLVILASFFGFLTYIKLGNVNGPGYAGVNGSTLSIEHFISSLTSNSAIFGSAILVNIVYLRKYHNQSVTAFYILIFLIIIPQLIIYNKTGMFWHYVLPAAIGVSWLTFYPISKITKQSHSLGQKLTIIVTIVILAQIIFTRNYFQETANRVRSVQSLVTETSTCVNRHDSLAIVGNPYTNFEILYAFTTISSQVIKNDRTYLATYGSKNSQLSIDILKSEEQSLSFLNPKQLEDRYRKMTISSLDVEGRSKIKGIVLANAKRVEQPLSELKLDWFRRDDFIRKYYPEIDISVYCKK
jgi:hypothetical protein